MPTPKGDELLSPTDAAAVLGVSTDSVRKWADEGKLPCQKTLGGRRVFRRSDVELLKQQRQN